MIPQRFSLFTSALRQRVTGKAPHVSYGEMFHLLTKRPWRVGALAWIDRAELTEDRKFRRFFLRGKARPIYWPADMPENDFLSLIAEQLDPQHWHYYRVPETDVQGGDVVLDCGASEGLFSFLAYETAREVYAVEPTRGFQECLERTFADVSNVKILPVALGSKPGRVTFSKASLGARATSGEGESVEVVTLDSLSQRFQGGVSYIKADVEGAEPEFLQGARETIAASKPRIAITTYHAQHHAREICEFLRSIDPKYRIRLKGIAGEETPVMLHAWV